MRTARSTHYETLGIASTADAAAVKTAYRRLVLQHHPDRSKDPKSSAIFMAATEAYQILSDREKRRSYDFELASSERQRQEAERLKKQTSTQTRVTTQARPAAGPRVQTRGGPVSTDVARLTLLFAQGRHLECERLARSLIERDSRQPVPYAVLGDLARGRRQLDEAAKMYSLALQMDPRNSLYLQRYEELLMQTRAVEEHQRTRLEPTEKQTVSLVVGIAVLLMAVIYLALALEKPAFGSIPFVSTWTLGLFAMLFLCGVVAGACLAVANLLDRLDAVTSTSSGGRSPTMTLGLVAIVSFPVAVLIYVLVGLGQRGFNYSTTRVVGSVAVVTISLGLAASLGGVRFSETLIWGGNLAYIGAIIGWLVSDSFR